MHSLSRKKIFLFIFFSVIYLLITLFFFRGIIFVPGHFAGGDWTTPDTKTQIDVLFRNIPFAWSEVANAFGGRQPNLSTAPYYILLKIVSLIGLTDNYSKVILMSIFTLAGISMFSLAIFLELPILFAFFSGLIYITSPIFFNYSLMGWIFVLYFMALLPLAVIFFITSVKQNDLLANLISGFICAISMLQPQSVIWFMMVFLALGIYLIDSKKTLKLYIKSLFINISILIFLNIYWSLSLFLVPDENISGSNIVKSPATLGMLGWLQPIYFIRLYGNLFNFQFEGIMIKQRLEIFSFLLPLLAFGNLLVKKINKLVLSFLIIALIPFMMYLLNLKREILFLIPFSNVIRDFLRFSTLSTFAYAILAAFFLQHIWIKTIKLKKFIRMILFGLILAIWLLAIYPWWHGELYNWEPGQGCQFRLRTRVFPAEQKQLEDELARKKLDENVLYLPLGYRYSNKDKRFQESCQKYIDPYATFSPLPGYLGFSDRGLGIFHDFGMLILNSYNQSSLPYLFRLTNIRYFIILKDALDNGSRIQIGIRQLSEQKKLILIKDNDVLSVYENTNYLPHFYIPKSIIISDSVNNHFMDLLNTIDVNAFPAIYFTDQNHEKKYLAEKNNSENDSNPTIEFKKIDPTKYRIIIHKATDSLHLVFNELFSKEWRAYVIKSQKSKVKSQKSKKYNIIAGNEGDQASANLITQYSNNGWLSITGGDFISKKFRNAIQNDNLPGSNILETAMTKPLDENSHYVVNGYANSWLIDVNKICSTSKGYCDKNLDGSYNIELIVEYWPQRLIYLGGFLSASALLAILYIISLEIKRRKKRVS